MRRRRVVVFLAAGFLAAVLLLLRAGILITYLSNLTRAVDQSTLLVNTNLILAVLNKKKYVDNSF